MKFVINQKQSRSLLEEHAKSSFNFTFLGRNEFLLAIIFLIVGTLIYLLNEENKLIGLPMVAIGLFEIIKYPGREKRWVKKKEKETIFNKNMVFEISKDTLKITYDKVSKSHAFSSMRKCLVSETGILFKISLTEYYYISFKGLETKTEEEDILNTLIEAFREEQIIVKRT
ncbi:hypothetical protein [Lewinella cohaerens]|uniref:hypothetical protein n=1 Tax=Lewinella cohaerens TaxID=70995 RepID=UPI0003658856|nr:hypothetical protein [Lewinella cohaerens]